MQTRKVKVEEGDGDAAVRNQRIPPFFCFLATAPSFSSSTVLLFAVVYLVAISQIQLNESPAPHPELF